MLTLGSLPLETQLPHCEMPNQTQLSSPATASINYQTCDRRSHLGLPANWAFVDDHGPSHSNHHGIRDLKQEPASQTPPTHRMADNNDKLCFKPRTSEVVGDAVIDDQNRHPDGRISTGCICAVSSLLELWLSSCVVSTAKARSGLLENSLLSMASHQGLTKSPGTCQKDRVQLA